jgi:ubiquinone/menaquinone biosynthesis C-methylase UbiE
VRVPRYRSSKGSRVGSQERTLEFKLPPDTEGLQRTGERFQVGQRGEIEFEHYHRYLFAAQFCNSRDVLDVACGEGYGGFLLSQVAGSVVGVDIDSAVIEYAAKVYGSEKLRFALGSCLNLPATDRSFDVVVSFETIEHIREHGQFLSEVHRVLRPDGVLIISTPDRDIYSNPEEPNPFHVLELTKSGFQKILRKHFSRTEIGVQKATTGSIVLPDRRELVAMQVFHKADTKTIEHSHTMRSAPFLLAIASNVKLPSIRWGILEDPKFFSEQRQEIEHRDAAIEQLVGQVRERDQRLEAADGELRRVIATADSDLRRLIADCEQQQHEIDQRNAAMESLVGEIHDRDQRLAVAGEELRRVAAQAEIDLRRAISEVQDRDQQIVAADSEVRRLIADVTDRDERLVAASEELRRVVAQADSDLRRAIGEIQDRDQQMVAADREVRRRIADVTDRDERLVAASEELRRVVAQADSDLRRAIGEIQDRDQQMVAADREVRRRIADVTDRDERLVAASEELRRVVAQADSDLRRAIGEIQDRDQQLVAADGEVRRLLGEVNNRDQRLEAASEELGRVIAAVDERDRQLIIVQQVLRGVTEEVEERELRLITLGQRLHAIETSTTWRITAPLRSLLSGWRRVLLRTKDRFNNNKKSTLNE